MTTHPSMNDVFQQLDKWRHFPAFPLEARSEVFFALFLPTVLEAHFKKDDVRIKPQVIPQFPLKHEDSNQSDKVDFFTLSEDRKKGYLIELKTDMASIREEQECYLKRAGEKSMADVLRDLKEIVQATDEKKKYYYLLNTLSELGLIKIEPSDELECMIFPENIRGVKRLIGEICVKEFEWKPEIVYIQPRRCEEDARFHYIYFDEFANIVESQGDMGGLFAGYLRKWIEDPAKSPPR